MYNLELKFVTKIQTKSKDVIRWSLDNVRGVSCPVIIEDMVNTLTISDADRLPAQKDIDEIALILNESIRKTLFMRGEGCEIIEKTKLQDMRNAENNNYIIGNKEYSHSQLSDIICKMCGSCWEFKVNFAERKIHLTYIKRGEGSCSLDDKEILFAEVNEY